MLTNANISIFVYTSDTYLYNIKSNAHYVNQPTAIYSVLRYKRVVFKCLNLYYSNILLNTKIEISFYYTNI